MNPGRFQRTSGGALLELVRHQRIQALPMSETRTNIGLSPHPAYQVEGAAKDEGRGPSVWDVLSHRVTDYILDNQTADVTDVSAGYTCVDSPCRQCLLFSEQSQTG